MPSWIWSNVVKPAFEKVLNGKISEKKGDLTP
jgi:hypothetical protein